MTAPPAPPPKKTAKEEAIAWLKAIGSALLIWIVLRSYLVEAFRIPSASMENTLLVGDFLFVNKAAFGGELERLDEPYALHTALTPPDDQQYRGQIRALQLPQYVGRNPDRYNPTTHDWGPIVVPLEHYWVMGDNRDESYDSRFWGFLPRDHIRGRPLFIYMSVATHPFRIRWNRLFRHPG